MKNFKKVLALVLAVATLLSFATIASASVADFKDSKSVEHTEAVDILSTIGVLNGYKDGEYKPTRVITRAEAAKIIAMFDNGDTNIKELYAPVNFTDVASNHWAQSYISYCYHTGIIAGVGNNKYAPEAEVTGVQFLKMVLVVLGFDAKEEGLVGTGYSVRARNLAREVGLLDGIGNDFDYTKGLSRDNAAQIMLNALKSETVEYGKTVTVTGKVVAINDSKAYYTGEKLAKEWNLYCEYENDVYGRPAHKWYWYNAAYPNQLAKPSKQLVGTYTDTPVKVYTEAVAGCDIYADTGLKGTFEAYYDGVRVATGETVLDKASDVHGAQGQVTEVYAVTGEFGLVNNQIMVHINTYLGIVTDVTAEKKDSKDHVVTPRTLTVDVYDRTENKDYNDGPVQKPVTFKVASEDFAAGDYVLVNGYFNDLTPTNLAKFVPVELTAAKTETAKLTGVDNIADVAKLSIAGTKTPVACKYAYDADRGVADCGKTLTFIFDAYGNIIGTEEYEAAKNYGVLDKVYIDYAKGVATVYATIVLPDGSKIEDVVVDKVTVNGTKHTAWEWIADLDDDFLKGYGQQFTWAGSSFYKNYFYGRMVDYSKNDNDTYNLNVPATSPVKTVANAVVAKDSKFIRAYTLTDGKYVLSNVEIKVSADTKFLFQNGKTTPKSDYKAYTGYETIPTLTYSTIQYVDADGDGVAEFVYVFAPEYAGSSIEVYYAADEASYEDGIYTYAVTIIGEDGKLTAGTVVSETDIFSGKAKGLYEVELDASGLAVAVTRLDEAAKATIHLTKTSVKNVYLYTNAAGKVVEIDLTGATLYNLSSNEDATLATLNGQDVAIYTDANGNVVAVVLYKWNTVAE